MQARFCLLRQALFVNQITQRELAKAIGKSTNYLSMCMNGKAEFDLSVAYAILDYFDIPHKQLADYFPLHGITSVEKPQSKAI